MHITDLVQPKLERMTCVDIQCFLGSWIPYMFWCDTTLFVSKTLPVHLIAECDNDLSISYLNNVKSQDFGWKCFFCYGLPYFDCQVCLQFLFFIVIIFYRSLEKVSLGIFFKETLVLLNCFWFFYLTWRQWIHELQRSVVRYFLCNLYTHILMQLHIYFSFYIYSDVLR